MEFLNIVLGIIVALIILATIPAISLAIYTIRVIRGVIRDNEEDNDKQETS